MTWRGPIYAALVLGGAACGGVRIELKPQVVEKTVTTNSAQAGGCPSGGALFGVTEFPVRAWLDQQGLTTADACLARGADFALEAGLLVAEGSHTTPDACSGKGLAGTLALSWLDLAYVWLDRGAARTETFRLACPSPTIELWRGIDVISTQVNACLASMGADGDEFLRQGLNRRPETVTASATGSCSADACYHLAFNLKVRLLSGTATTPPCE